MKKLISTLIISSFMLASLPSFAGETEDLKSGKLVIKEVTDPATKSTEIQLVFVIKAKPEKVWETLVDYDHYTEFMPLKEVKVKSKHGSYDIVYFKPETPMGFDTSYELKRSYFKDKGKITFEKHSGKIKSIHGYWKLEAYNGNQTKATYVNEIDIGMPVPGFVKDYFTKGGLKKLGEGVKKRVESNGTWKR
ncbi:MAG: SRPBCC family protein [Candidatus Sericytochromatia bacterium]